MGRRRSRRSEHRPFAIAGSHWRADGGPKARYATEREASSAAHLRWVEDRVELNVYPCDFCDGWHMGRSEAEPR